MITSVTRKWACSCATPMLRKTAAAAMIAKIAVPTTACAANSNGACQNGGAGPPSLAAFCVPTLLITDDSPCLLAQRLEVRPGSCKLCHASRAPKLNERTGEAPTASRLPSCGQTPPKVVLGQ